MLKSIRGGVLSLYLFDSNGLFDDSRSAKKGLHRISFGAVSTVTLSLVSVTNPSPSLALVTALP